MPWVENEEYRPKFSVLTPRLGVAYFPESTANPQLRPLKDWAALSAWMSALDDPPAEPTASVQAKSAELTAGAASELAKIRAIAAFAQQTNYVAVEMNITHGGGYTPHPADLVLKKNYGDCKEKAALMRALLKSAGIESYAVAIYSGDRQFVRKEWPSPMQFNHAIVAVKVSPDVKLPTVTDARAARPAVDLRPHGSVTPVGDLPSDEQGSYASSWRAQRAACSRCLYCRHRPIGSSAPWMRRWTTPAN